MARSASLFAQVGASIMGRTFKFGVVKDRRFRAHFGNRLLEAAGGKLAEDVEIA